jgi:catechol 2,3-dioxygenase-like lactoylglutathione lyase family enzyme
MTMLADKRAHTTLPTADLDRLRSWYEGILGFEPFAVRPGAVLYRTAVGSVFAISRGSVVSSSTHTQMAFTVDDIEAEVTELQARGVVFETYETPKTTGGIATIGAGRAAWFKDPDGNVLAILQFDDPA